LLLAEKQSMAQIVCNELAELTWQSSSDLFMFRLTHLRNLSESWLQVDASRRGASTVATTPSASSDGEAVVSVARKAGMVTRSKSSTVQKPVSPTMTSDETSVAGKTPGRSKAPRGRPRKTENSSATETSSIVIAVPVDESNASFDLSELVENEEDGISNASAEQSEDFNGW
jgi:transglutaminase/protease-like cytokinesis protein 3